MAGNKYLEVQSSGALRERTANDTSAGVADAGKIVALNGSGVIDPTLLPPGVATDTVTATAFENLTAGDFVYIRSDGQVAKAVATSRAACAQGFVLSSVLSGATATVYLDTRNTGLSGLTPGETYYLSASTAGQATAVAPTTAGQFVQSVGRALSATVLSVEIELPIERA